MRNWYEFILRVRPYKLRSKRRESRNLKAKTVKVVARSKFDAELAYRNTNPGVFVEDAKRLGRVEPPDHRV